MPMWLITGKEDEVEVDLAQHLLEPLSLPTSHDELVCRAPLLGGHNELVGVPKRVTQPRQLLRRLRVLHVRQQIGRAHV